MIPDSLADEARALRDEVRVVREMVQELRETMQAPGNHSRSSNS
jgi:hypothetical protein